MKIQSQTPALLKFGMYFSELAIINMLFYTLFGDELSPGSANVFHISALYGWMSMALMLAYIVGIWIRPISFFNRSYQHGSITANVFVAVLAMAVVFVAFLVIFDRRGFFSMGVHHLFGFSIHFSLLIPYFFLLLITLILWRYTVRWMVWWLRRMGRNQQHVVMVGFSDNLLELWLEMQNPVLGYHIIGYFNNCEVRAFKGKMKYLGSVEQVHKFLENNVVQQLYCALPSSMAKEIVPIIDTCERSCCHFFSVPNVRNYLKRTMQMEILGSVPVLTIREDQLSGSLTNRVIKRTFDIVVSLTFILTCFWWIYIIVAILTKIFQPGPVFFRQKRNGLGGREFVCLKFRSMKVNKASDDRQASPDDERKTKFGAFLRKTSIDELPQFINVLKGDMSIVGPRPHMVKQTAAYAELIDKYMVRHWIRPGITGWAQVTGSRGETRQLWQMEERIKKDIWYIENWSLMLDLQIILMTIWNAFRGDKNAY
ncbi:MAG: undecaprenyl-phosphate glucose phosphotransferase [Bacteroidales bacterium]|jgi:putative colanic acid biosynthesis UDP-glucose lipid carrier transferase|nr:undecaprenyl-phosphate glucose phosphotransferase [Bacteroidales bacterium]